MQLSMRVRWIIISLIALSAVSCASTVLVLLRFQDRSYTVCEAKNGLCYPHEVCEGKWYNKKCKFVDGYISLETKEKREKFRNAGFVCRSPLRFK